MKEKKSVPVQKGPINPNPHSRQLSNEFSRAESRSQELMMLERMKTMDYYEPKK